MNLIEDPILSVADNSQASLPALFAQMAKGEVRGFPALRPHQRPAWHMFLVQLGALAASKAQYSQLPDDVDAWASALRGLTPDYLNDEPWRLAVEDRSKPAFLQPPDPGDLKWSSVPTPDALDLLITSKNHDVKKAVARKAAPEDWVFALTSLQTCEGYGGVGNHGIARMNGGSSSRPMLGLSPTQARCLSVNPSAWWRRDTLELISRRNLGEDLPIGEIGGSALLWCLDWPEAKQLHVRRLDPWFIEVCRRVRLTFSGDDISAERATSKAARIHAKKCKGNVGDPWAPVHKGEGKALTLSGGNFDYARLSELLFSGDWKVPCLASAASDDGDDMLLLAEALSRGNSKTEGFKSRVINVPTNVLPIFSSDTACSLSKAQIEEINAFDSALRDALALVAAGGNRDNIDKKHYARTHPARRQLDRAADRIFFPHLWRRLSVASQSPEDELNAKREFLAELRGSAEAILEMALPSIPCAAIYRPRAEARARYAFRAALRRSEVVRDLFIAEENDAATN